MGDYLISGLRRSFCAELDRLVKRSRFALTASFEELLGAHRSNELRIVIQLASPLAVLPFVTTIVCACDGPHACAHAWSAAQEGKQTSTVIMAARWLINRLTRGYAI